MRRLVVTGTFLILLLVVLALPVYSQAGPLTGYKICLDPGHGGSDPGAVNATVGLEEKDINLDVSYGLKRVLEADGAVVVLTRTGDQYLENRDRYTFCNEQQADILVSVHTNSVLDITWDGTYVLHSPKITPEDDWSLAQSLHDAMFPFLHARAPEGVEDFRDFGLDRFASGVLFKSDMAAAIIEPLFMSNEYEGPVLLTTVNFIDEQTGLVVVGVDGNGTPNSACADLSCRRGQIVQSVRDGIIDYFVGASSNQPPVASFTAECSELICTFDASASGDPDGEITTYDWDFGDGQTATGVTASHSYAADGAYDVVLTVTDDGGALGTASETVTVSGSGGAITLTVVGYKVKGVQKADLTWSGASGPTVDVLRDGAKITSTANDGAYTDEINVRGLTSYTYQVCEPGTAVCSNVVTVVY